MLLVTVVVFAFWGWFNPGDRAETRNKRAHIWEKNIWGDFYFFYNRFWIHLHFIWQYFPEGSETIHGAPAHHDEITRRRGSYADAVKAGEFLISEGAELSVSLMLNRFFVEDADNISGLLKRLRPHFIYFAIPIYTPHRNMPDFEPYRASLGDLKSLRHYLAEWNQDPDAITRQAEQSTAAAAVARFAEELDLQALFAGKQDELYLSLHQDCRLYVGNSGGETQCLGDLRSMDLRAAAEAVAALPGNRDYGAFYDTAVLPSREDLVMALSNLPQDMLFGDFPSVIYRGLSELRIPTKIIC